MNAATAAAPAPSPAPPAPLPPGDASAHPPGFAHGPWFLRPDPAEIGYTVEDDGGWL